MIVRVLGALGIGALAMYFFDPISGKRRRERVRDQMDHARRDRGQGLVADARGMMERRMGQRRQTTSVDIDLSQLQP